MRNDFDLVAIPTLVDVTAQRRRAAGGDLAHGFEYHRTNPFPMLRYERAPMRQQNRRESKTNLLADAEHNPRIVLH
jgi:hypothetical protein